MADPVHRLPLAGESHAGRGELIEVRSPYDGHLVGTVPRCDAGDVDRAVTSARTAMSQAPLPPWRRAEILDQAVARLSARIEEFAATIADEAAKPIRTARVEAQRAVGTFQFAAAEARTLRGEMVPLDAAQAGQGKLGFTLQVPIGVIGAISPFNFPLNLVAHKLAPAIAAGCAVVLKPASRTPITAVKLAWMLIEECGLPPEYLHVVTGSGDPVGNALVDHPEVALITFTGSPDVGWAIRSRAPRKRVGLELGNNAPVIIEPDGEWRAAAAKIKVAGFSHAGQSCISTQRIYVHRSIASDFTAELVSQVRSLVVGDPMDEATDVSALISTGDRDRVCRWIDDAVSEGARVEIGGTLDASGILLPTVVSATTGKMAISRDEVFGPVVGIEVYDDLDQAFALANDTRYGLQAAVFTSNLSTAMAAVHRLDFGGVLVNEVPTWRIDHMPYGGVRDSGNTREGPAYSVREMTETRLAIIEW